MNKNIKKPLKISRRNFLKNSTFLSAFCITAPSLAGGGLIATERGDTSDIKQNNFPLNNVKISNKNENIQFRWKNGRLTFELRSKNNRKISGLLSLQLMFYADERNNMHGYSLDDRIKYESEHLRKPINFLQNRMVQVSKEDANNDHQSVTFIQELEGYRVELNFRSTADDPYIQSDLRIRNVSNKIQRIMMVRCGFDKVSINGEPAKNWLSPPESYKNHCHTKGKIADIIDYDLRIFMPPCGITQPVMFLGDIKPNGCALEFSPWLSNYGAFILTNEADISYNIYVDKYLSKREEHHVGTVLFKTLHKGWRQGLTEFTENVPSRFGHEVPDNIASWTEKMRVVTFPRRFYPIGDERWMSYFRWAKEMGFNATMGYGWLWKRHKDIICAIKPKANHLPLDAEHGATEETVRNHNRMLHELDMKSILWFPTTGASPYSEMVEAHPNWFIRDEEGELRGSWYRDGEPWLIDSNPLEEGYYRYWRDLVFQVIEWGFDGIFLDGVIARPSDAFSWPFPGNPHNGMYRAVQRLRADLAEAGHPDFVIIPESGDVMILPGANWMYMPWLTFDQASPLSKEMSENLQKTSHYFLSEDCPRIDESLITEHIEISRRVWPKGMPGRCDIGRFNDPNNLTPKDIGEMQISYFVGSVPSMGLSYAKHDPEFQHYDPSFDNELSKEKIKLKRQWFRLVKKMNVILENYSFIPGADIDFDSIKTNDGAVPAFARVKDEEAILVVGNLSKNTKNVEVRLTKFGKINLTTLNEKIRMIDVINDEKIQISKNELIQGKTLRLTTGTVKAWYVL